MGTENRCFDVWRSGAGRIVTPFNEGYHAGLVNDRNNPHAAFSVAAIMWHLGNDIGVRVHCELVEAVYRNSEHD